MRIRQFMIVFLAAALSARADVVVLHNGQRIEGEIIARTDTEVTLQRSNDSGNIHVTEAIPRHTIAKIIETGMAPSTQPAKASPRPAVTTQPAASTMTAEEKWKLLDDTIARYQRGYYRDAGMRISRLIVESDAEQREAYDTLTRAKLDLPLAHFAADIHVRAAIDTLRGTKFRLRYVTDYEKPALSSRLESLYRLWVAAPADTLPVPAPAMPTTQPAASQPAPAGSGPAVADWLEQPGAFEGSIRQQQALADRAELLISVLDEWHRLLHDPDRDDELLAMRDLDRRDLAAFVTTLTGRRVDRRPEARVNPPRIDAPPPTVDDAFEWLQQRERQRRAADGPLQSMLEQRRIWLEMRSQGEYQETLRDELGDGTEKGRGETPEVKEPGSAVPPPEGTDSNSMPDTTQEQDDG